MDLVATLINQAPFAGGALLVVYLLLTGKLHTHGEFRRVTAERDEYKAALDLERKTANELAATGGVTNRLVGALVTLAAGKQGAEVPGHELSPTEEIGL